MSEMFVLNGKNGGFAVKFSEIFKKMKETNVLIKNLQEIWNPKENETIAAMLLEQENIQRYRRGYLLGMLMANHDTLPSELADRNKFKNGIPIDMMVKITMDDLVLNPRKAIVNWRDGDSNYGKLSSVIWNHDHDGTFDEERFKKCFPNGMDQYVLGFAEGYSKAFHLIAKECRVEAKCTRPKEDDILKNCNFFLSPCERRYTLEGSYECFCDKVMKARREEINMGVYQRVREQRALADFAPINFDFDFEYDGIDIT